MELNHPYSGRIWESQDDQENIKTELRKSCKFIFLLKFFTIYGWVNCWSFGQKIGGIISSFFAIIFTIFGNYFTPNPNNY